VLNDFGSLGLAYVDADAAEADEATIIENSLPEIFLSVRVIAFNTGTGLSMAELRKKERYEMMRAAGKQKAIKIVASMFQTKTP